MYFVRDFAMKIRVGPPSSFPLPPSLLVEPSQDKTLIPCFDRLLLLLHQIEPIPTGNLPPGFDLSTCRNGAIPISQHWRNVEASGNVPSEMESAAGGKCWINTKSLQLVENWEKLSQERAIQTVTDPTSGFSHSDNENFFIEATEGFNKKGKVFGLGASRLKSRKRSSSYVRGVSADELKKMKNSSGGSVKKQKVNVSIFSSDSDEE
ncbi:hypothetical protein K1719_024854 [Acacia pycnantha]|nr:hypothetical protein K1719_024854 [Acacia pycnantha]